MTLIPFALFHSLSFPPFFFCSEPYNKPGLETMFTKQHSDYEFHWIICSLFYLVFFPHFTSFFNYCGSCFSRLQPSKQAEPSKHSSSVSFSLLVYLLGYPTWASSWTISHLQHGIYFHYCFRVTILQLAYLSGKIIDLSLFFPFFRVVQVLSMHGALFPMCLF